MILTYNSELRRFEFRVKSRTEKDATGRLAVALATSANFRTGWERRNGGEQTPVFHTIDPFKAQTLIDHAQSDELKQFIRDEIEKRGGDVPILTHLRKGANVVYVWSGPMAANGVVYKDIPKRADFAFTRTPYKDLPYGLGTGMDEPVWYTEQIAKAAICIEYADEQTRAAINEYTSHRHEALAASRAEDADIDIPVPEGLQPFAYQRGAVAYAKPRKRVLFGDEMGLGKAQPLDAMILTPSGFVRMGDIKQYSLIIGSDGELTEVEGIFPQGERAVIRVTFSDGSSTECDKEHLWYVNTPLRKWRNAPGRVMTTRQIAESGLCDAAGNSKWFIPLTEPVQFPAKDLPLDPYLLGVLLGDGGLGYSVRLSSVDDEILAEVTRLLPKTCEMRHAAACDYVITQLEGRSKGGNTVLNILRDMGLIGCKSADKFIPLPYLLGSVDQRIALLQGLLDTDGYCSKGSTVQFYSVSDKLADDVAFLVRSLGGTVRSNVKKTYRQDCHVLTLALPDEVRPFRLSRKAERYRPRVKYQPARAIVGIQATGETKPMQCIRVKAVDSLYITDDFIVTHNTIEAILWINVTPEIKRVLVICPASLKYNWRREMEKWLVRPTTIGIADTKYSQPVPQSDVVIINYDILAERFDTGEVEWVKGKDGQDRAKKKYKYELRQSLNRPWDLVIVDEAHRVKGEPRTVIRARMVLTLLNLADRIALLTGTPVPNRIRELWNLVHVLGPKQFPSKHDFLERFCKGKASFFSKYDGASNLDELQEKMRLFFMVRRLKRDVLKDLPPKLRQVIELPADGCEAVVRQEIIAFERKEDVLTNMRLRVELAKASERQEDYTQAVAQLTKGIQVAFEELSRIRRETALAKIPAVTEHVGSILAEGHKVLLFVHHKEVARQVADHFPRETVVLTGDTSMKERDAAVQRFQKDDSIRLFIGTIGAAGVGLTLTASSYVVFAELDWVPANVTQAEDRAHRIGQLDSVLVQHLVLRGSLDKRMADVLVEKQDIADRALDRESVDELLADPVTPGREKMATQGFTAKDVAKTAEKLTAEDIKIVHMGLRMLAGTHKDSRILGGLTFRAVDAPLGKILAEKRTLTPRLAALGRKFLSVYRHEMGAVVPEISKLFSRGE